MVKRRSPFFTSLPSLKSTLSRYPLTRARTSTVSGDSSLPMYSSHSITSRATGWTTVTVGGGAVGAARFPQPANNRAIKSDATPISRLEFILMSSSEARLNHSTIHPEGGTVGRNGQWAAHVGHQIGHLFGHREPLQE